MTTLVATIEPDGAGARIAGRIGPPNAAIGFLGCWFGILIVISAVAVWMLVMTRGIGTAAPVFLAVPLGMMAIGGLIGWIGLRTRRSDEAAILAFLAAQIDAREARA